MSSAGAVHAKQRARLDAEVIGRAAAAQNRLGGSGLVDTVDQQAAVDMDANHFAEHQPGIECIARRALQLDDLGLAAFEGDRAFAYPWYVDLA